MQIIVLGAGAWAAVFLTCYLFLRRVSFSILDPLMAVHLFFVPFVAAQLTVLCSTQLVSWQHYRLFWLVLFGYLLGARIAGAFFGRTAFRKLIVDALERIRRTEIHAILLLAVVLTLVLAILALKYGAQGDARQGFAKLFRPLVVVQNGLYFFALVLLLSRKLSKPAVGLWMVLLVIPSVTFSGKSVLLPLIYWFGLKLYLDGRGVSVRTGVGAFCLALVGVATMGIFAYGASSAGDLVHLLINRVWMSGETYIYAYQRSGMAALRGSYDVSFFAYLLHPLTSLVGIRGYDMPLGAALFSEVVGGDVVGGPNPILPVLLDYFFPDSLAISTLVALSTGIAVIGIRCIGPLLEHCRSRYVVLGGATAAIFCPGMGFLDTSLVLIALIGIVLCTAIALLLELILAGPPDWRKVKGPRS